MSMERQHIRVPHGLRIPQAGKTFGLLAALLLADASELLAQTQPPAQQQPRPQQPRPQPPQQAPKPAQAQPAQPAQPPQQQQVQQPEVVFSPWVKLCNKDSPNGKQTCMVIKNGRVGPGSLVVSVALVEVEGEMRKMLRLSMPYGLAVQHGTRMIIDDATPATSPFITCLPPQVAPGGCISDYEATPAVIESLRKGRVLTVQAINASGQAFSPQLSLADFAKAYSGRPTDFKAFEEQQNKDVEEMRKKFQQQNPPQQQPQQAPPKF
jgi:invasion protein IalB